RRREAGRRRGTGFVVSRQVQRETGQVAAQAIKPWDDPARQQAAGAAKDEGPGRSVLPQSGPDLAELPEHGDGAIAQLLARRCQCDTATLAYQQRPAQGFFQRLQLPAYRAVRSE